MVPALALLMIGTSSIHTSPPSSWKSWNCHWLLVVGTKIAPVTRTKKWSLLTFEGLPEPQFCVSGVELLKNVCATIGPTGASLFQYRAANPLNVLSHCVFECGVSFT